MRRTHKKSRRGCLECKRRHIKCDETHPSCLNCLTAERACSYPERVAVGSGQPVSNSPTTSAEVPTPGPTTPEKTSIFPTDDLEELSVVNMLHMELYNHFTTEVYMTSLNPEMAKISKALTIKCALNTPYLMHQILALAARHLSILRPEKEALYRHQAIQLQTSALSLFNAQGAAVDTADRVPMLLFSSILGLHALCDMLSVRDDTFEQFYSRFMSYFRLHRGVHSVIGGSWPAMLESDLRPIIELGSEAYRVEGKGHECDRLRDHFRLAGYSSQVTQDCERSISRLQYVFDEGVRGNLRAHLVLSFPLFIHKETVELVEKQDENVILLLAYYAVALHFCRDTWIIGEAGKYVFDMMASRLGPEYDYLLEWPREAFEMIISSSDAEPMDVLDPELSTTSNLQEKEDT